MKKYIIILLIGINFSSIAQNVTIKMEIQKQKTKSNRWHEYKSYETPFLIITYINNTNESIYFRSGYKNFHFAFAGCIYDTKKNDKLDVNRFLNIEKNKKYIVDLFPYFWSNSCEARDSKDNELERTDDFVNYYLGELYQKFYKDYQKQKKNYFTFNTNVFPLTEKNIFGELREYFIFLKKGKSYTVRYDLTGFQILGGTYIFNYYDKQSEKFVETTSSWNETQKMWIQKKKLLPSEVKGYKLYLGDIKSNEVSVNFDTIISK